MPLDCSHPLWALCAAAILFAAAALCFGLRGHSRRWKLAAILLPAAAAASAALALSGLAFAAQSPVAIILDFSPSARTSPWHDPQWVRDLAARRLRAGVRLTIVGDDGAQRRVLLADVTAAEGWPGAFNWDAAPAAAANLPRQQWLITDGLIAPPAAPPAAVSILPPAPVDFGVRDMALRSVDATSESHTVEILVQLRAAGLPAAGGTRTATLEIERDGRAIATIQKEFGVAAGKPLDAGAWVTIRDRLSPEEARQPHRYTAILNRDAGPRGDPWPENDRGVLYWPGASQVPRVLTIGRETAGEGRLPAGQFHKDASQLAAEGWQAVILDDVQAMDAGALSAAQAEALDRFVRQSGGGLLIASRSRAFGPGRYGEGEGAPDILERLSPLWSRPPEGAGAGIIFVLDASASMNEASGTERKFSLVARAVEEAARYLGAGDSLAAITFNREAQLLTRGRARQALPGLSAKLRSVAPQGETSPDAALDLLGATLAMPEFRDPTVIFLTDGEIPALSVERWRQVLGRNPFVVVAPTPGVPATPLQELATLTGARWQTAATPAAWQALLPQLVLEKTRGRRHDEALDWRAGELAGRAPSWIETWLKSDAQLLAEGLKSDRPSALPVAAIAQRGLGKVAAVTIPDDESPAYAALQAQLLQKILAPAGDRRFHAEVRRRPDGRWLIRADGVDGGMFLNGVPLSVNILSGPGPAETLSLQQIGPGRYEALAAAPGAWTAVITRGAEGGGGAGEQQLVARVQAPDVRIAEFPASVDEPWVPERGMVSIALDSAEPLRLQSLHEMGPCLWVMAAAMALAAIWLRM